MLALGLQAPVGSARRHQLKAPVIVTTGEGVVKTGAGSRLGHRLPPNRARRVPEGSAARERGRDEGGARQAEGARSSGRRDSDRRVRSAAGVRLRQRHSRSLREYVARNTVEVRVDEIARAGEVLDAAVGSGATTVSGVRFDLKDRTCGRARGAAESGRRRARARRRRGCRCRHESRSRRQDRRAARDDAGAATDDDGASVDGGRGSTRLPPMAPGELEVRVDVSR